MTKFSSHKHIYKIYKNYYLLTMDVHLNEQLLNKHSIRIKTYLKK